MPDGSQYTVDPKRLSMILEEWGPVLAGITTVVLLCLFADDVTVRFRDGDLSSSGLYRAVFGWSATQTGFSFGVYVFVIGRREGFVGAIQGTQAMSHFVLYVKWANMAGVPVDAHLHDPDDPESRNRVWSNGEIFSRGALVFDLRRRLLFLLAYGFYLLLDCGDKGEGASSSVNLRAPTSGTRSTLLSHCLDQSVAHRLATGLPVRDARDFLIILWVWHQL